ncbi:MAG: iron ABC transporter permease [Nevskiaceae bacterium]|nr:MAG: iron ABC transporter permease [Nevskiaceae bacterium]TBR73245.1 MAG: iron ABC transporter permease [Nevskiaceae bacterium]
MSTPAAALEIRRARRRWPPAAVLGGLAALAASVAIIALCTGAAQLSPTQVWTALVPAHDTGTGPNPAIVTVIRLPRLLLALLVGAVLAVSGAAMQGLFRNPLADPGLIGVSAGAALGAVCVIVLGSHLPWLAGALSIPLAAALGGLAATLIVYRLGRGLAGTDVATLLLAGIAINAIAGAGTGLLTYFADDRELRSLTFWLMGSLGGASWSQLAVVAPFLLLALVGLCTLGRPLNAFLLGEDVASHLGYPVERIKILTIVLCAVGVGAAVAVTGAIGFVGLVVPHLLRLSVGANHRLLLPASALLGAAGLTLADTASRTVVAPAELPIGILTALFGGPFFIYLLTRRRRPA